MPGIKTVIINQSISLHSCTTLPVGGRGWGTITWCARGRTAISLAARWYRVVVLIKTRVGTPCLCTAWQHVNIPRQNPGGGDTPDVYRVTAPRHSSWKPSWFLDSTETADWSCCCNQSALHPIWHAQVKKRRDYREAPMLHAGRRGGNMLNFWVCSCRFEACLSTDLLQFTVLNTCTLCYLSIWKSDVFACYRLKIKIAKTHGWTYSLSLFQLLNACVRDKENEDKKQYYKRHGSCSIDNYFKEGGIWERRLPMRAIATPDPATFPVTLDKPLLLIPHNPFP